MELSPLQDSHIQLFQNVSLKHACKLKYVSFNCSLLASSDNFNSTVSLINRITVLGGRGFVNVSSRKMSRPTSVNTLREKDSTQTTREQKDVRN